MSVVRTNFPTNLFAPAVTFSNDAVANVASRLHLQQVVQAVIVEAESDQVVLEIGGQRYQAPGKNDFRGGEKITLQVQKLDPQLEFRVFDNSVNSRMSRTFPVLSQPFNWGELIVRLQALVAEGRLPQAAMIPLKQLDEVINFSASLTPVREKIMQLVAQLQQFNDPEMMSLSGSQQPSGGVSSAAVQNYRISVETEWLQVVTALVKNLQKQVLQQPQQEIALQVEKFMTEIEAKINSLPPDRDVSYVKGLIHLALKQIRQIPELSPRVVADIQRFMAEIEAKSLGNKVPLADKSVSLQGGVDVSMQNLSAAQRHDGLEKIEAEINSLLQQVSQLQKNGVAVSPDLLGRLDGLKLQLQKVVGAQLSPEVTLLLNQIATLLSQCPTGISGEQLGILSQLFGLHLEAELLNDKKREVLENLKLCLLELKKDGDDVHEPLRRLELFQLCKAKLSADQVQFVPLPLSGLEDGYLLAEREDAEARSAEGESPLKISLSLRLSSLGNVRVDMLYEPKNGLHLRLAGEDLKKMNYLKSCEGELVESLQAIKLQGVSFSSDAGLPAKELQERILAESFAVLDTRV